MKATDFLALCKWIKAISNRVCDSGNSLHRNHQNKGRETGSCAQLQAVFTRIWRASTICVCPDPKSLSPQLATRLTYATWCSQKGADTVTDSFTWSYVHVSTLKCFTKSILMIKRLFFSTRNFPKRISAFITIFRFFWKQPKKLNPEGKAEVPKISWLDFFRC